MTQLHILHMLERHGEMPMSRLADVLDVSVSNATGLVDRMEERGLVARTRVPEDRRVVLVEITSGRRLTMLGDAESLRDDIMRRVLVAHRPVATSADIACAMTDLRTAVEAEVTDPASTIHAHQHTREGLTHQWKPFRHDAGDYTPTLEEDPALGLSHRAKMEILFAVMLGLFLGALDQTIVGPALPTIVTELSRQRLLRLGRSRSTC